MSRREQFFAEVLARGGRLPDQNARRELARICGYPPRGGICSYFGGQSPSMVQLADGSSVLTPYGWRRARSI